MKQNFEEKEVLKLKFEDFFFLVSQFKMTYLVCWSLLLHYFYKKRQVYQESVLVLV